MRIISGRQNPAVRVFRTLASDTPSDGERVLLDGAHLVREARDAGTSFEIVAVASSRLARDTEEGRLALALEQDGVDVVMAPDQLFSAISPVRTPSGIIAVGRRRPLSASEIGRQPDALLLVAVDVQDPGNLGSLLRAAEAGGIGGVSSLFATLRGVGAVVIVIWVSPTIGAFFVWQAAVSLAELSTLVVAVHRWLPRTQEPARFSLAALAGVFAARNGVVPASI